MKITIEQDECVTVLESPITDIWDVANFLKASLVAAGYHPDTVDGIFCEEITWSLPEEMQ